MSFQGLGYLHRFRRVAPQFRAEQSQALQWLAEAHATSELQNQKKKQISSLESKDSNKSESLLERTRKKVFRFGCSTDRIRFRNSALADFTHQNWQEMEIFALHENPQGRGAGHRSRFFSKVVEDVFEKLYAEEQSPPPAIVHVTCTGYVAPSGAQRLVSKRGWGEHTEVLHAYHMGCYASLPAIRLANGLLHQNRERVDIVHTELCTVHLNPAQREVEQLVVQTLFSDGLIRYSLSPTPPNEAHFQVIATREEIISDSLEEMSWMAYDHGMQMTLSRNIAEKIEAVLENYLNRLFEAANLDFPTEKDQAYFAIHPGGPRIIDQIQKHLGLRDSQVQASDEILRAFGNMSSATLPHIWEKLLEDPHSRQQALVVSMGFGPGLTISGAILRLQKRGVA